MAVGGECDAVGGPGHDPGGLEAGVGVVEGEVADTVGVVADHGDTPVGADGDGGRLGDVDDRGDAAVGVVDGDGVAFRAGEVDPAGGVESDPPEGGGVGVQGEAVDGVAVGGVDDGEGVVGVGGGHDQPVGADGQGPRRHGQADAGLHRPVGVDDGDGLSVRVGDVEAPVGVQGDPGRGAADLADLGVDIDPFDHRGRDHGRGAVGGGDGELGGAVLAGRPGGEASLRGGGEPPLPAGRVDDHGSHRGVERCVQGVGEVPAGVEDVQSAADHAGVGVGGGIKAGLGHRDRGEHRGRPAVVADEVDPCVGGQGDPAGRGTGGGAGAVGAEHRQDVVVAVGHIHRAVAVDGHPEGHREIPEGGTVGGVEGVGDRPVGVAQAHPGAAVVLGEIGDVDGAVRADRDLGGIGAGTQIDGVGDLPVGGQDGQTLLVEVGDVEPPVGAERQPGRPGDGG